MNNKQLVGGISCDLEKAFDCVNHNILLSELKFYGISEKDLQLCVFFWVFPRRQILVSRRFGTLCQFHLQRLDPAFEDGTDTGFRNVGLPKFDAGEIPKRIHTIGDPFH
jgi:hypothetical protein